MYAGKAVQRIAPFTSYLTCHFVRTSPETMIATMKKYPLSLLSLILLIATALTACSSDDIASSTTNDCLITGVTLGSLKGSMHGTTSAGEDTTYNFTVTGSNYPMSIDQVNNRIYNVDSLPVGTDVSKVVFSTFNASNDVYIKSLTTGEDSTFSASDSTDFSQMREVKVYSTDASQTRTYTIELRVHKEAADSVVWRCLTVGALTPIASFVESRTLAIGDMLYIFGNTSEGHTQLIATPRTAPTFSDPVNLPTGLNLRSIQYFNDTFYALTTDGGTLVKTTVPTGNWVSVTATETLNALIATSADSLYALAGGKMYASTDGETWQESASETAAFPTEQITSAELPASKNKMAGNILVVGKDANGNPLVWRKNLDDTGDFLYPWINLPQTEELGAYGCPSLSSPSLLTYDNAYYIIGIDTAGNVSPLYCSNDEGRTWKTGSISLPSLAGATALSATVDADNYIWIAASGTGMVYKGKVNRLGWNEENTRFEKSRKMQIK